MQAASSVSSRLDFVADGSTSREPSAARRATLQLVVDDAALVARMAVGDEHALGTLYDGNHRYVYSVVRRILRDDSDSEDIVEAVFWQVWRQAPRYQARRGSVKSWLGTIARSRSLDRLRATKRRREEQLDESSGLPGYSAEDESDSHDAESSDRLQDVLGAMATLPVEQREALELGYFVGLSQSEIAARTGQPLGTVKTRIRQGMRKMRARLDTLRG